MSGATLRVRCPDCGGSAAREVSSYLSMSGGLRWCAETHCAACGFMLQDVDDELSEAERAAILAEEGLFALRFTPADGADVRVRSAVRQALSLTFAEVTALFRQCPQQPVTGVRAELDLIAARIRRAVPAAEPVVMPLP
ncbi:hypothetical protein QEZ54_04785 [Catellatospora sp. KI3]|uniref:hypothetical protein n=1 Tax=Catellatospora sp. KI3 TaxID=3041620 RepID=UPI0024832E84|nr:hypothetical protein [Catellatospora sp. KI3]MDI1460274.1 hypothetical protein [Catellatospora sp. KI3]